MSVPAILHQPTDLPATEIRGAVARYGQGVLREWRGVLEAVEERRRGFVPAAERDELGQLADHLRFAIGAFERAMNDTEPIADRHPEHLSWYDITTEIARSEQDGWQLWERAKQVAREELATGQTAGRAIESYDAGPFERAQFVAMRDALADGLQPRNGLEWLLVDTMAQALTLHHRWLAQHATMAGMDAARVNADAARRGEWTPPRLAEAEAVDRAAMHADRAMRTFARTLRAYRDGRKLIASLTVTGGQVNVADTQLIATGN